MKNVFLVMLIITTGMNLSAQNGVDALTAVFDKSKPVQIISFSPITQTGDRTGKKYLRKHSDFTEPQIDSIFNRIVKEIGTPKDLKFGDYEKKKTALPHYKAYNLSDFSVLGYAFVLVWVPYDENQHMPEGFRPTAKEGILFYTSRGAVSANGRDVAGQKLPLAGTPVATITNNSKISHSTADMSSQIVNGKIGVILIYFGNKNTELMSRTHAYTLYGDKQGVNGGLRNEKKIADQLAKLGAYSEYMGYHFIKGGECVDAENYLQNKFSISKKQLRFYISCSHEQYIIND